MRYDRFAELFNKLRLKAGFETLASFGKELAAEGYVFEDSTFSRWKSGTRAPRHPRLLHAITNVFHKKQAISANEVIELYESVGLSAPLTTTETSEKEENLICFLQETILGHPFVSLHYGDLQKFDYLAQVNLRQYILLLRAIQHDPRHYIRTLPYIAREPHSTYDYLQKKPALVMKPVTVVMGKHPVSALMYPYATHHLDPIPQSLSQQNYRHTFNRLRLSDHSRSASSRSHDY